MITAIDTNIISALWSREPTAAQMAALLAAAGQLGGLVICAPVYVELLAHPKATRAFVDEFLSATNVAVDFELPEAVWREAGRGFVDYASRRRTARGAGGEAKRLLVDFLVGAHAALRADRLFTLDAGRYSRDFPRLKLVP